MAGAQGRSFCRGCDSNCIGSARLASGFRKHVKQCPPAQALLAAARGQLSRPAAPAEPAGTGHAAAVGAAAGPPAAVTAAAAAAGAATAAAAPMDEDEHELDGEQCSLLCVTACNLPCRSVSWLLGERSGGTSLR